MASQHFTEALKQAFAAGAENASVAAAQVASLVLNNKELDLNGVSAQLAKAITDNDANTRQTVCAVIAAIAANKEARTEPYLTPLLGSLLDLYTDKKMPVRAPAAAAAKAIVQSANHNSLRVLLPQLFSGLDRTKKWQTKEGALNLISDLCELHPVQVSRCLPDIMPNASEQMWDTRPEVKKAAHALMIKACSTASNADIEPFIPALISCIANPSEVSECVHKLASTTFVKTVEAPALAIMEPLLVRGLNENKTAVKRQTAVIIDNMCKLVEDPAEALLFTPKVLPTLKRIIEAVADPECRDVCKRAHDTLFMAAGSVELSEDETKVEFSSILDALKFVIQSDAQAKKAKFDDATLNFVAGCGLYLTVARNFKPEEWSQSVRPYFAAFMNDSDIPHVTKAFREKCYKDNKLKVAEDVVQEDEGEDLCDCEFSLAYGGMILLNNARMNLKKGHRYGLCGPNGCGKSTLMRAIANGQLEGFPSKDELKTVYVEHNLQAEEAELSVVDFVLNDPEFKDMPRKEVQDTLASVGFTDAMQAQAVGSLSGGWKMKLELARAMLQKADILLLDEPTNHLDVANVAWLENYLTSMGTITSLIVSHDSGFLDNVCTNIIHYEKNRKLKTYVGNMSKFVELRPEAKAYYDLDAATIAFKFPEPGFLADIKNKGKPIIRLTNCSYTYPGNTKPSINNVSITCALSSRIAVIGPNGAGKSTMIKMLTGETEPTEGTVWKHPAMRFAYVAQHAFHHIEQHLDISANQYIQWRFQSGEDKELMAKETRKLTPEEKELLAKPVNWEGEKRIFESIENRRKLKKSFEYEIKWQKLPDTENSWIPREKLEKWGFDKILQIADDREAARANMQARPVTALAVQKHLDNFGLGAEFGTHSRMRGLSGGQKVKVVLAAAMWLNPHILVLDEPTNFLDRDSLGALAGAIKEFGGGVVMISHNREFTDALAQETWNVVAGQLTIEGQVPEDKTKIEQKDAEESVDAFGNKVVTKVKRKLTRKELKAKLKAKKEAEKRGEYYSDSDLDVEPPMAFRRAFKFAAAGAGGTVALGAIGLYLDAPIADNGELDYLEKHAATRDRFPEFVYNAARATFIFYPATLVSKVYMGILNSTSMKNEDSLAKWILARPPHRALITVTNHSSTVDDPAVFARILPWSCVNPRISRWGLCSQEYCYTKGPLLSAVFYASKTLPIKRGAGLDHPMLEDLFKKVQNGEWVHVFPEGKIVQGGHLGQREGHLQKEIGGLKWGVGKLIARAERSPIVVPIYHLGMDKVMPQNANHKLKSMIPRFGQHVHVRVGEPIYFDDLMEKYAKHRVRGIEGPGYTWKSSDKERELYSAITRRIEQALLALEAQCYEDLKKLQ